MGDRKQPTPVPVGLLRPLPPPAPPRKRLASDYRDVDNRDKDAVIASHEALAAPPAQNEQARQRQLWEERLIALEEQLGALWAILESREKEKS